MAKNGVCVPASATSARSGAYRSLTSSGNPYCDGQSVQDAPKLFQSTGLQLPRSTSEEVSEDTLQYTPR